MNFSEFTLGAKEAALLAGAYLKERFGKVHTIENKEGKQNLVTESDTGAEKIILSFLQNKFPSHGFLSEEKGTSRLEAEVVWIVDPLDGTVNFAKNIPHFCVSIAACLKGEIVSAAILHPLTGELFVAEKSKGAFLNGTPIKVTKTNNLDSAILASGFPYNVDENPMRCIDLFTSFLKLGCPIRRFGSAALDLAYLASGRFDAYWETGINPWDVSAGILLVTEAGGTVSGWKGEEYPFLNGPQILASNFFLHSVMVDSLHKGTPK